MMGIAMRNITIFEQKQYDTRRFNSGIKRDIRIAVEDYNQGGEGKRLGISGEMHTPGIAIILH